MQNITKARHRHSSGALILLVILIFNLSPLFKLRLNKTQKFHHEPQQDDRMMQYYLNQIRSTLGRYIGALEPNCPNDQLADALVLGKMARVWYIKRKLRKISKKLKKGTIALPVFTTIPIYEHSYYPQQYVTHASPGASSSYVPISNQVASANANQQSSQRLATSASSNHHQSVVSFPMTHIGYQHHQDHNHLPAATPALYHNHQPIFGASHLSAAYSTAAIAPAPSPPLFVDDSGGLYGYYGNAYNRNDQANYHHNW